MTNISNSKSPNVRNQKNPHKSDKHRSIVNVNKNLKSEHDETVVVPSSSCESLDASGDGDTEKRAEESAKKGKRKVHEANHEKDKDIDEGGTMCRFPVARVKNIMKEGDSNSHSGPEAVFLISKASELFVEKFCGDAHSCMVKSHKKALCYNHFASVARNEEKYEFLRDYVPVKLTAEAALAEWNFSKHNTEVAFNE